ncbi:MAG: hypothetical protein AAGJ08_12955 [Cyanobacteria bacterium P01_H01_bin.35]
MSYSSIDQIQKVLAQSVFKHTLDKKKAAGRALGTIVEIITYYLIRQWNLSSDVTIELRLPEFGQTQITHNVEFGIHPCIYCQEYEIINPNILPLTSKKLVKNCRDIAEILQNFDLIDNQILSRGFLQRNRCLIGRNINENKLALCDLKYYSEQEVTVEIAILKLHPFAIFECKRVGIEEGAKKGPTTIEKAKQGAYVAKHISSLQKIRSVNGKVFGALAKPDGSFEIQPYEKALNQMIYHAPVTDLTNFILTIGIASNHGNLFTSDNPNKELLVLKHSYDWLLFLTDEGLAKFVRELILEPLPELESVQKAFLASYDAPRSSKRINQFTKVRILRDAHIVLINYFSKNIRQIEEEWFNILSPQNKPIITLQNQLKTLAQKEWYL